MCRGRKNWKKIHLAQRGGSPTDRVFAAATSSHVDTCASLFSEFLFINHLINQRTQCALLPLSLSFPLSVSAKINLFAATSDPSLSRKSREGKRPIRIAGIESSSLNGIPAWSHWISNTNWAKERARYTKSDGIAPPGFLRGLARTGCAVDGSATVYVHMYVCVCVCASRVRLGVCDAQLEHKMHIYLPIFSSIGLRDMPG